MTHRSLLIIFAILGLFLLADSRLTPKILEDYKASLGSQLKSGSVDSLQDIYYKVISGIEFGKLKADTLVTKDAVCNYLAKIEYKQASERGLASKFNYLYRTFGCVQDPIKAQHVSLLKDVQKADKLEDIYTAIKLVEIAREYNGTGVANACEKVLDLVKDDGTTKLTKRSSESSLSNTAKVLEIVSACKNLGLAQKSAKISTIIENVLKSLKYIGQGTQAFVEGNFYKTTAALVSTILKLNPNSIQPQTLVGLVEYFRSHESVIETPEENYLFFQIITAVSQVPIAKVENQILIKPKDSILRAKLVNILGEEIVSGKATLKGTLFGKSDGESVVIGNELTFVKKSNNYEVELKNFDSIKPGAYQIKLSVTEGKSTYHYVESVIVRGSSNIGSVRFGITKSQNFSDIPLEHSLNNGETYKGILSANQGNYVHIELKVPANSPKPSFIGARLSNKNYRFATGTVPLRFDRESNMYRGVIDLGDPDHTLPYNGQYDVELILSGEFIQTIQWKLASINLTFIKPATQPPASDADVIILPEIHHHFPGERTKPPAIITTLFDGLVVVVLIGFFVILGRIGVNWNKFPKEFFGSISALIFLGLILALFGTLTLFWLKINIFQTLLLLVLLAVPTVIVGDFALRKINLQG